MPIDYAPWATKRHATNDFNFMKARNSLRTYRIIVLLFSFAAMNTCVSCGFKQKIPKSFQGEAIISGTFMDQVYILNNGRITSIKARNLLAAQRGPDGNIYAMEYINNKDLLGLVSPVCESIVVVRDNGSTEVVFKSSPPGIYDFTATKEGLLILVNKGTARSVDQVNYEGKVIERTSAPADARQLTAHTSKEIILSTGWRVGKTSLYMLRGKEFVESGTGFDPLWVNRDLLFYDNSSPCVVRESFGIAHSISSACHMFFARGASLDGRYLGVVGTYAKPLAEFSEISVIDTRNGEKYPLLLTGKGSLVRMSFTN